MTISVATSSELQYITYKKNLVTATRRVRADHEIHSRIRARES